MVVPGLALEGEIIKWLEDMKVNQIEKKRDWDTYLEIALRTGVTRESLIDEQNAMIQGSEFEAKKAAYATKEEAINADNASLFDKMTRK